MALIRMFAAIFLNFFIELILMIFAAFFSQAFILVLKVILGISALVALLVFGWAVINEFWWLAGGVAVIVAIVAAVIMRDDSSSKTSSVTFNKTNNNLSHNKSGEITFADFYEELSKKIKNVVRSTESKESWKYIGGDCTVLRIDDCICAYSCNLYFQDKNRKLYKIESKSPTFSMNKLPDELRHKLMNNGSINFKID